MVPHKTEDRQDFLSRSARPASSYSDHIACSPKRPATTQDGALWGELLALHASRRPPTEVSPPIWVKPSPPMLSLRHSDVVWAPGADNDLPSTVAAVSAPPVWRHRPKTVPEQPETVSTPTAQPPAKKQLRFWDTAGGMWKSLQRRISGSRDEVVAFDFGMQVTSAFTAYIALFCLTTITAGSVMPSLMLWPGLVVACSALLENQGYLMFLSSAICALYLLVTIVAMSVPIQGFEQLDHPLLRSLLCWCFIPLGVCFCGVLGVVGAMDPFSRLGTDFPWTPLQQQQRRRKNYQAASTLFAIVLTMLNCCSACVGGVFFCLCATLGCLSGLCAGRPEPFFFAALSLAMDCLIALVSLVSPLAGFEAFSQDYFLRRLLYAFFPLIVINQALAVWSGHFLDNHRTVYFPCWKRRPRCPTDVSTPVLPRFAANC